MWLAFAVLCGTVSSALCVRDDQFYGPQTFQNNAQTRAHTVQYSDSDGHRPPPSAILTHKQGLTNDGVFNYIFAADNGLKQGESIAPDGTRTGAYQYIDPSGKTIFVKYMAGKDGFKILEGDHIPRQPDQVKPLDEYQSPEHRKDYRPEQQQQQQQQRGVYKTEEDDYQQERPQRYQQPIAPKKYQAPQQNQRYTAPQPQPQQQPQYKPQAQLFKPQQGGNRGGQRSQDDSRGRPMLYNVEQRHNVNYRKYQDNGQPLGSDYESNDNSAPAQDAAPHSYGSGYNFEFKG